jgi:hypothetical protein
MNEGGGTMGIPFKGWERFLFHNSHMAMNVWAGCGLSFHPLSAAAAASALPGKRYFRFLYVCVFSRALKGKR